MDQDIVLHLRQVEFMSMSPVARLDLLKKGRPTPVFKVIKLRDFYKEFKWLCGCSSTAMFCCWPCVLFAEKNKDKPTRIHFRSPCTLPANLTWALLTQHKRDASHKQAEEQLEAYIRKLPLTCITVEPGLKDAIGRVSWLIDVISFLAVHKKIFAVDRRRDFNELTYFLAKSGNCLILEQLQGNCIDGFRKKINVPLLKFLKYGVRLEIQKAVFKTLSVDEVEHRENSTQITKVLRFVNDEGKERVMELKSGTTIGADLNKFDCQVNLIFSLTRNSKADIKLILNSYSSSFIVPSLSPKLMSDLEIATASIKECNLFFETCTGLFAFLLNTSKRLKSFEEFVVTSLHTTENCQSLFTSSNIIITLDKFMNPVRYLLDYIGNRETIWGLEIIAAAKKYAFLMRRFEFKFIHAVFSRISPKFTEVYSTFQKHFMSIEPCEKHVAMFEQHMKNVKDDFEAIWSIFRFMPEIEQVDKSYYCTIFYRMVDNVVVYVRELFKNLQKLSFISLLDPRQFHTYNQVSPGFLYSKMLGLRSAPYKFYPNLLETDLRSVYKNESYQSFTSTKMFCQYLCANKNEELQVTIRTLARFILTVLATIEPQIATYCAAKNSQRHVILPKYHNRKATFKNFSVDAGLFADVVQNTDLKPKIIKYFARNSLLAINL